MFLGFSRKKLNGVRVHNDRLFVRVYRSCSMPGYNQHRVTLLHHPIHWAQTNTQFSPHGLATPLSHAVRRRCIWFVTQIALPSKGARLQAR